MDWAALSDFNDTVAVLQRFTKVEERVRLFVGSSVAGQHANVALMRDEYRPPPNHFMYKPYCVACRKCFRHQGWRGRASFDSRSKMLVIPGWPVSAQGQVDRVYGSQALGLNALQKAFVRQWLLSNRYRIMPLMIDFKKRFGEAKNTAGKQQVRTYASSRPAFKNGVDVGFSTSFFESVIAVASSESALSYCRLADSFAKAVEKHWEVDVLQPDAFGRGAAAGPMVEQMVEQTGFVSHGVEETVRRGHCLLLRLQLGVERAMLTLRGCYVDATWMLRGAYGGGVGHVNVHLHLRAMLILRGCYVDATWMLRGCYVDATWMLRGCYVDATWMLRGCYVDATWMLRGCYVDATWMLRGCYVDATWMLRGCYVDATWMLRGCYVDATWMLRGCYVDATWMLRGCYVDATWMLRGCYVDATWMLRGCYVDATWGIRGKAIAVPAAQLKVDPEWIPDGPCAADVIDVSQFDVDVFHRHYMFHPRPLLIKGPLRLGQEKTSATMEPWDFGQLRSQVAMSPAQLASFIGAGRPSNEAAGNWTREGLLQKAGDRKVDAELFPRAQVPGSA
eukprot:Skav200140  [mRNA]  locus=scaffold2013:85450:97795:+ [translate_table: standard]